MTQTTPIAPTTVRYIKLGAGGSFARSSLDNGELQLGYHEVPHDLCAAGDWDGVLRYFAGIRRSTGKAKDSMREVQDFYTLGSDCLWIMFADGSLWWGFAEPEVTWLGIDHSLSASRVRRMIGGWRSTSILGVPLRVNDLTTRLTQVANYRGTICAVRAADYLLRKINAEEEPMVATATSARAAMLASAMHMIAALHWADFEIMVDLIFARGGWQRVSVLGKTMADVDLILEQPTLGETASVQVKSRASQAVLDEHIAYFDASGHDRTFFVCHSPTGSLSTGDAEGVHLWTGERLADMAVKAGLYEWLMDRVG
ncbi:MAG: hypothetical protein CTY20_05385 [Hyphomicrobium sp.]|nr:MAG: hypothetical protein CTY20_05385 [Hyphomicrobium sp.]